MSDVSTQDLQEQQEQQQELEARMAATVGVTVGPQRSWDPINVPMIRQWCQAMGDDNPLYNDAAYARSQGFADIVAPPTMLQAWTMKGYTDQQALGSVLRTSDQPYVLDILDEYGYVSVVAVNCDQNYFRHLHPGDDIKHTNTIESVSELKHTALGEGYFVTELWHFTDQHDAPVGEMRFRLLKFKAPQRQATNADKPASGSSRKVQRPQPGINRDNRFFWQGLSQGKLLIQRCTSCDTLRHPPAPMCPSCRSLQHDAIEASGKGVVHSFVNLHHPALPAFDEPNPIALVELEEGTRLVAQLIDIEPQDVTIGLPVEVQITEFDGDQSLALFKPAQA
ncbi:bifunctional MaoC family dehydratase N-terminal/OB-fold nucleic acid binding domain-containing protein [Ferrimonas pelagia]|uniref:OB-fold domain-containing protein n=1 Tax=Ferrimonas pelagia TaxID=1177826 RepID=A0ABP9EXL8_9GAMM